MESVGLFVGLFHPQSCAGLSLSLISRDPFTMVCCMKPLSGQVAVVAGATRGAGRGVARALGEAGATVYCTGRSVRGNLSPYGRPETIDETAELVEAAGGHG